MKRKYDMRNKRSFIIILILSILVVGIFSLFIYKYRQASKIKYVIDGDSVIQDTGKNKIHIDEEAILKKKWNGIYYLVYQDNTINLDKRVIVYNNVTGSLKLYGTFYEINELGKIEIKNNETILKNTTDSKFYKLTDRIYLLVDRVIQSSDNFIQATGYLLCELDKLGNAKLTNNKLDLKTITKTEIVTSNYRFDINNEILTYKNNVIDLKKIIGSSNMYVDDESDKDDDAGGGTGSGGGGGTGNGTGNGDGSGEGTGGGTGSGGGTGTGSDIINGKETSSEEINVEELKRKAKRTSIIRIVEGLTDVDIDYVIYDPFNEYLSVYAEIENGEDINKIVLPKNDTHIVIDNLMPGLKYNIKFMYTTSNTETGINDIYTFEELEVKTLMPKYNVSIYKISNVTNSLTYKVNLQSGLDVSKVNVNISFDYIDIDVESGEEVKMTANIGDSLDVSSNETYIYGNVSIGEYNVEKDTLITINVESVEGSYGILPINSYSTFRFGR